MAVLNPAVLRRAIAALITTVPGAGTRVHTQRRIVRDEQAMKRHLFDASLNKICGWMVSPAPSATAVPDVRPGYVGHGVKGGGNVLTAFQFQIEAFHVLDDVNDSEQVFGDLVWAVADEFNAYGSIPAAAADGGGSLAVTFGLDRQLPCAIDSFGYIMFAGSFLLHYARLDLGFIGRTRPNP